MREIVHLTLVGAAINWTTVLKKIGMAGNRKNAEWMDTTFRRSRNRLLEACDPVGILEEMAVEEFAPVYQGEGKNEHPSPLAAIFPSRLNVSPSMVT